MAKYQIWVDKPSKGNGMKWKDLDKASYTDILYNISEVIFNMYYSNYPRTVYEDMRYFMIYKMINVISTSGVDTMRNFRTYLFTIARNGGSMYLYHYKKGLNTVELTDLNTPSIGFNYADEISSKTVYEITSKFLDLGDYTKDVIKLLEDYNVRFDNWYDMNIGGKELEEANREILFMIKGMVLWRLSDSGGEE